MTDRKTIIGNRIAQFRKQAGLTQAELARQIRYSDKALSKWERGESLPDIITLMDLAAALEVPVQSFLEDVPPENISLPRKHGPPCHWALFCLILAGIAALGILSFVILRACSIPGSWIGLVYCLPAGALAGLIFSAVWRRKDLVQISVSCLIWGILLSICISLQLFGGISLWYLLLLGIPAQAAVFVSFHIHLPAR